MHVNIDFQPVSNYYKAVGYLAAYLSKFEQKTSEALSQVEQQI